MNWRQTIEEIGLERLKDLVALPRFTILTATVAIPNFLDIKSASAFVMEF